MKEITIYTDGACSGNPGPGGWGAILIYNLHQKEISGGEKSTTNNRMELTALIKALEIVNQKCKINIYTDSKYLCDGINKGWAENWRKNNWKKSDNKPAVNSDLWGELLDLLKNHEYKINWVKGHAGHPENERCDKLATDEIKKINSIP
ncbi:MAG: ribonuclease HI [Clostridia bacterium]|nr:ribonuclease HI [Clostridia bacterium]